MAFSMYKTVSSYNDKRVIEKDKNEILSYKYLLTKTIQDDFVNNELSHVSIENNFDPSGKKTYILHCTLKKWYSGIFHLSGANAEWQNSGIGGTDAIMDFFFSHSKKAKDKPKTISIKYHLCDAVENCIEDTYSYKVGS